MNHKKLGLICYGTTNSGKNLLADLLTSEYKEWEVGVFSCPPGININQFYLDGLLNTFIYRCDEIVFENINIVQKMKTLLEGSRLLDTDIIYKAKQQILPAPTVINMNGSSIQSIFKWCHKEIPAFKTRVVFLKMHIPLQNRVESKYFQYLAKSGKEFIYILTKCFMDLQNETTVAIKDCTSDICI